MSMAVLTILQFIGIFAAYLTMTLFLPAILFHKRVQHYEFSLRFMIYFLWGNFYMMNVVFILQLLHICNRFTLILVTFALFLLFYFSERGRNMGDALNHQLNVIRKYLSGVLGRKTLGRSINRKKRILRRGFLKWFIKTICFHFLEFAALMGLVVFTIYIFGSTYLVNYGYNASDLVVHNYWINGLKEGKLFVAGIYPFGYHIVLYFLSEVFGIRVLTLLRLFGLVQILYVELMLIATVSALSKSKYVAYLSGILYLGVNVWNPDCFARFHAPLPQEYGMIFILPSVCFALRYFQLKEVELYEKMKADGWKDMKLYRKWKRQERRYQKQQEKGNRYLPYPLGFRWMSLAKKWALLRMFIKIFRRLRLERHKRTLSAFHESSWMLIYFALAFQATLAVHFYDTIIAGIAYIAIAIAFFRKFMKGEYFCILMQTGILAFLCAIYPFVFAFLGGTPFQGSMGWALGVIKGDSSGDSAMQEELNQELQNGMEEGDIAFFDSDGNLVAIQKNDGTVIGSVSYVKQFSPYEVTNGTDADASTEDDSQEQENQKQSGIVKRVSSLVVSKAKAMGSKIKSFVLLCKENFPDFVEEYLQNKETGLKHMALYLMIGIFVTLAVSILVRVRSYSYGQMVFALGLSSGFLALLLMAEGIGLPVLIDANRTRYFFVYFFSMMLGILVDAVIYLVAGWKKWVRPMRVLALGLLSMTLLVFYQQHRYVSAYKVEAQETNGSILCTSSILETHTKKDFTIVSANDEMQMLDTEGFHTETIDLLREMEGYDADSYFACPTEYVYVYVEKYPLDYYTSWYGSGSEVSEEGAALELPKASGLDIYVGENRWIVMSKLYYWAKEFQRMYPNEMNVYYEDDDFICYEIKQNTSALLNLAIDYGFNVGE